MPFIEGLGQMAAQSTLGGLLGIALQGINDRRQLKQQQKLQDQQIAGQMTMTNYNSAKQLQMWKDTNYSAQIAEMKKAGLSPGLIYGIGVGGGATASITPGNVAGGQAPSGGGEVVAMQQLGIQGALMEAQRKNIEADTRLKEVEANKKAGVDTREIEARIGEIRKRIESLELSNEFNSKSMADRLDTINSIALKEIENLIQAQTQTGLDRATVLQKAEQIKQEAIGAQLRNLLTKARTGATTQSVVESKARIKQMKAETDKWAAEIAQGWKGLSIQDKRLRLDGIFKQMEVEKGYDWRNVRYEYNEKDFMKLIDKLMEE